MANSKKQQIFMQETSEKIIQREQYTCRQLKKYELLFAIPHNSLTGAIS